MKQKPFFLILIITLLMFVGQMLYAQEVKNTSEQAYSDVIEVVAPNFPAFAIATNTTGKILVEVIVDGSGKVTSLEQLTGHPLFKAEIERTVKLWKFKEALDKQTNRKFILTFDFVIEKYDGNEERQIISFMPPFEVKVVKKIPDKDMTRIPHPPAITTQKKKSSN